MPRTLATARYSIDGYRAKVLSYSPIAYWPLNETSGTVADNAQGDATMDGAYSDVRLGRTAFVNGEPAGFWDGSLSYCNIYSAALNAAFNGGEGTVSLWLRVSNSSVWADGSTRRALTCRVDASNLLHISKLSSVELLSANYISGGITKNTNIPASSAGWLHLATTWSAASDQTIKYLNGIQSGATQTGLGVWAGAFSPTRCLIGGDATTPTLVWLGYIHDVALFGSALSAAAIADLAVVN